MPEANVRIWLARNIEAAGVMELTRIAIRRAYHRQHEFPLRDHLTMHFDVAPRLAEYCLERRAVAEDLLDRGRQKLPGRAQAGVLVRVLDQAQNRVVNQVCGRLATGQE